MEMRRIQITGGSSYMVTLPKSWADSVGLKKNDPVSVDVQPDGRLVITPGNARGTDPLPKTVDTGEMESPEALYRCLIGAYIAGHGQILVRSNGPMRGSFIKVVSDFTQTSMGMEIVEEDEDRILIKDLIDHSEIVPERNVRREYLLVGRMVSDVLGRGSTLSEMESRDTEVDRIHWLVQRQVSIHEDDIALGCRMGVDLGTVVGCMGVSKALERIGDHAVSVARHMVSVDPSELDQEGLKALDDVLQRYLTDAMDSWSEANRPLAEKVLCGKRSVLEMVDRCFGGVSDPMVRSLLVGSCTRIADYCTDIAESAIDLSMEKRDYD